MFSNPDENDFKTLFFRDFPYGGTNGDLSTVQDQDITQAILETGLSINPDLFGDQSNYQLAFLYLAAHMLSINLKNSTQGLSGTYSWLTGSRGAGSVSSSYSIPEDILKNPVLAQLSTTQYGAKYLSLILSGLSGGAGICVGQTQA